MDFSEQLRVIQQAQGDPAMLALATVDLAYPDLPNGEKTALKEALEAAAIPHWCDETSLAALLQIPQEENAVRFARLRGLNVVEAFPARGGSTINLHEASRLALRKRLFREDQAYFRMLSGRAAAYFADECMASGRIEWIYHLLCGEPERGAKELEKLYRAWSSTAHHEDVYALALALRELEESQMVENRARAWMLIAIGWSQDLHGEVAQLGNLASQVLLLAEESKDQAAECEAQSMLGDVLQAQGKLEAALTAFEQALAISRRLAEQDPSNIGWQQNLGVAHCKVGDVLQAQGKLEAALTAFEQFLAISRRLAEQDRRNAGWQRDLGVAASKVGDALQAQGKLEAAQTAFEQYLFISRRLAEQDPSNAGWQRELGVAHSKVGDALQAQGKLDAAQTAFEQYLFISRRLAEQDPSNAGWQRELGVAHNRVGDVLRAQGKLEAAQTAFKQFLSISRRLAEQDPSNAGWQRDLGVALYSLGDVLQAQGKLEAALTDFKQFLDISLRLAEQAPNNADWQHDLGVAHSRVGDVLQAQGKLAASLAAFEEYLAISRRLAEQDPSNAGWQRDLDVAHGRVDNAISKLPFILSLMYKMKAAVKNLVGLVK